MIALSPMPNGWSCDFGSTCQSRRQWKLSSRQSKVDEPPPSGDLHEADPFPPTPPADRASDRRERIRPPWLGFEVTTPGPIEMGVGTLIEYRLRLHRVPIRWRTWIEAWEPPRRFVNVQIREPYSLWEHARALGLLSTLAMWPGDLQVVQVDHKGMAREPTAAATPR
jgi:hypothetical protein